MIKVLQKHVIITVVILFNFLAYSQVTYEKGYYINNDNKKIDCFIKEPGWDSNPTEFKYKLSEDSQPQLQSIKTIKEFGVYNESKYIKQSVLIDVSSDKIDELNRKREPEFEEKEVLLKVLVEGKANLLSHSDGSVFKYFLQMENAQIEQLVFKRYIANEKTIKYNNRYKQQITNNLKCEKLSKTRIDHCEYKIKDLTKIFIDYNTCVDAAYKNFITEKKRDFFNLNFRPGINFNSLELINPNAPRQNVDFSNITALRIGLEGEFIFHFNKSKWSFIFEPVYTSFKADDPLDQSLQSVELDYKAIEMNLGLRHYFFLNQNSKIFINVLYTFDILNNSSLKYSLIQELDDLKATTSFGGFGAGYSYKNYMIELRYIGNRDIFKNHFYRTSNYKVISFILGYSFL